MVKFSENNHKEISRSSRDYLELKTNILYKCSQLTLSLTLATLSDCKMWCNKSEIKTSSNFKKHCITLILQQVTKFDLPYLNPDSLKYWFLEMLDAKIDFWPSKHWDKLKVTEAISCWCGLAVSQMHLFRDSSRSQLRVECVVERKRL